MIASPHPDLLVFCVVYGLLMLWAFIAAYWKY